MNIELIQGGRVLRQIHHNGRVYAETPDSGEYAVRLTNNSPNTRMAVVSVDGKNVIDAKDAGYDGAGWVLGPWQSATIKGYLRSGSECARFTFTTPEASYAAQTGSGTKNTGVIGVAVFEEAPKPAMTLFPTTVVKEVHHHHHHPRYPWSGVWYGTGSTSRSFGSSGDWTLGSTSSSIGGVCDSDDVLCSVQSEAAKSSNVETNVRRRGVSAHATPAKDTATAYGRAEAFHTRTVEFVRATTMPALVLSVHYGTTEKLREWGVPVDPQAPSAFPNAFPAAPGYAQPPVGWRG